MTTTTINLREKAKQYEALNKWGKSMKELRQEARERCLRGYSTLIKDRLTQLLSGEMVKKNLKKKQRCQETQT